MNWDAENALRFAWGAARGIASQWWTFASGLNGEMAIESAERTIMIYEEGELPLIKGLQRQLELREDSFSSIDDYHLQPNILQLWLEDKAQPRMEFDAKMRQYTWVEAHDQL